MSAPLPPLLPQPQRVRRGRGLCRPASWTSIHLEPDAGAILEEAAEVVAGVVARGVGIQLAITSGARPGTGAIVLRTARLVSTEHYRLELATDGATLVGGGAAGLFYGAQTLAQLLARVDRRTGALPAVRIEDGPDFPARGFYHDVSRGKVPTRATLLALVETLARHKVNQLQLYVEHTFAFKNHPDIWAGSDPLTAEDIRAVDAHAARHHIELVPSLSTFGHFYTGLVSPRKQTLNELPIDASQLPFSIWDRMGHYTLDCRSEAAFALVRELILELRPLFRSTRFNLCCDETFDLGKGRNAAEAARVGNGRLYLDFLLRLIGVVREAGATPMFWGDIVGNHPELVRELPRDVIALDWDYSAELKDTKSALFRKAGVPFYVCPGVSGWDRWLNDLDTATANITAFARRGRRHGAAGLLNTDWGDRGHINALGNSLHGAALGAAVAWNGKGTRVKEFDAAFAVLELGDPSGRATALLREAGNQNVVSWRWFTLWLDPTPHRPAAWWDERTGLPDGLLQLKPAQAVAAAARLERLAKKLVRLLPGEALTTREILNGARGAALLNRVGAVLITLARGGRGRKERARGERARRRTEVEAVLELTNEVRRFEAEFSALWHERNKPSEYWRVRTTLLEIARRTEIAALRGVWVKTERAVAVTSESASE